jgi:RNA polymerase sigma-70 factor (ECF subfamily)
MIEAEARGAWSELERHLRPYVGRRVASDEVDDVLQDVLLRLHQGRGTLRDAESFGGWVYRVARHVIIDRARARSRRPLELASEAALDASFESLSDPSAELEAELGQCVALFVGQLPSPYREAITLTELQGLGQRQAAEMLGISLSGMKSRIRRGRQKIREMFQDCCEIALDGRGRIVECEARAVGETCGRERHFATPWGSLSRRRPCG